MFFFLRGSISFSVNKKNELNWLNYLNAIQYDLPKTIYVKKIGYVSQESLKINVENMEICNIEVEKLTEKFNNSISSYL